MRQRATKGAAARTGARHTSQKGTTATSETCRTGGMQASAGGMAAPASATQSALAGELCDEKHSLIVEQCKSRKAMWLGNGFGERLSRQSVMQIAACQELAALHSPHAQHHTLCSCEMLRAHLCIAAPPVASVPRTCHSQSNMVAHDDLAPLWRQGIWSHHLDLRRHFISKCSRVMLRCLWFTHNSLANW